MNTFTPIRPSRRGSRRETSSWRAPKALVAALLTFALALAAISLRPIPPAFAQDSAPGLDIPLDGIDYQQILAPLASEKYCEGAKFKLAANVEEKFNNCAAMQSYYDESFKLLENSNNASSGERQTQSNSYVSELSDFYKSTGITLRDAKTALLNQADFHARFPNVSQANLTEFVLTAALSEIRTHQLNQASNLSSLKLFRDTNEFAMARYGFSPWSPSSSVNRWFFDCQVNSEASCEKLWATVALKSENSADFAELNSAKLNAPEAELAAEKAAQRLETVQGAIRYFSQGVAQESEQIGAKSRAFEISKKLLAPGFDPRDLTEEDLDSLRAAGVATSEIERSKEVREAGLETIASGLELAHGEDGLKREISKTGDCAPAEFQPRNASDFAKCFGSESESRFQSAAFNLATEIRGEEVKSATPADLKSPENGGASLPIQRLESSSGFENLKVNLQAPASLQSSAIEYLLGTQNSENAPYFRATNDAATYRVDKDFVHFRPSLKLVNNCSYIAVFRVSFETIDASRPDQAPKIQQFPDHRRAKNEKQDYVFPEGTQKIHVELQTVGGSDRKSYDLAPLYHQQWQTTGLISNSAALEQVDSQSAYFGKDKYSKPEDPKIQEPGQAQILRPARLTFSPGNWYQAYFKYQFFDAQNSQISEGTYGCATNPKTIEAPAKTDRVKVEALACNGGKHPISLSVFNEKVRPEMLYETSGTLIAGKKATQSLKGAYSAQPTDSISGKITSFAAISTGSLAKTYRLKYRVKTAESAGKWSPWKTDGQEASIDRKPIVAIEAGLDIPQDSLNFFAHTSANKWVESTLDSETKTLRLGSENSPDAINNITGNSNGTFNSELVYGGSFLNPGLFKDADSDAWLTNLSSMFKIGSTECTTRVGFHEGAGFSALNLETEPSPKSVSNGLFFVSSQAAFDYAPSNPGPLFANCRNDEMQAPQNYQNKDNFGNMTLGNIAYEAPNYPRGGFAPTSQLTEISYSLKGDLANFNNIAYRVFQEDGSSKSWSSWGRNGAKAGNGKGKIYAIEIRLISALDDFAPLANVSSLSYISNNASMSRAQVAFFESGSWHLSTCSQAYISQAKIQSVDLKNPSCGLTAGDLVKFGFDVQGRLPGFSGLNSAAWSSVFVFDPAAASEFSFLSSGGVEARSLSNILELGYGAPESLRDMKEAVLKAAKSNLTNTALAWATVALGALSTALVFAPAGGAITLAAGGFLGLVTAGITVAQLILQTIENSTPVIKELVLKDPAAPDALFDAGNKKWKVSGFSWANYGSYMANVKIKYQEPQTPGTATTASVFSPQIKEIKFGGKCYKGCTKLSVDEKGRNNEGKADDPALASIIPQGSLVWLESDSVLNKPQSAKYIYDANSFHFAGYLSAGIAGKERLMLVSYDQAFVAQNFVAKQGALASRLAQDDIKCGISTGFWTLISIIDISASIHGLYSSIRAARGLSGAQKLLHAQELSYTERSAAGALERKPPAPQQPRAPQPTAFEEIGERFDYSTYHRDEGMSQQMDAWYRGRYENPATRDGAQALTDYKESSDEFNEPIWLNQEPERGRDLDETIRSFPITNSEGMLIRNWTPQRRARELLWGVDERLMKMGQTKRWVSTSPTFLDAFAGDDNCQVTFRVMPGAEFAMFDNAALPGNAPLGTRYVDREGEMIFPRGTRYMVTKRERFSEMRIQIKSMEITIYPPERGLTGPKTGYTLNEIFGQNLSELRPVAMAAGKAFREAGGNLAAAALSSEPLLPAASEEAAGILGAEERLPSEVSLAPNRANSWLRQTERASGISRLARFIWLGALLSLETAFAGLYEYGPDLTRTHRARNFVSKIELATGKTYSFRFLREPENEAELREHLNFADNSNAAVLAQAMLQLSGDQGIRAQFPDLERLDQNQALFSALKMLLLDYCARFGYAIRSFPPEVLASLREISNALVSAVIPSYVFGFQGKVSLLAQIDSWAQSSYRA